jgi:hypothetical protein
MPPQQPSNLKIETPRTYHGIKGGAEDFITDLETYFHFSNQRLSDTEKIRLTALFLRDAARLWYKGLVIDDETTWDEFKSLLTKRFTLHNAINKYSDALRRLKQSDFTPIELHNQQFETIYLQLRNVGMKMSDEEAFQRYRQTLNTHYAIKLAEHPEVKTHGSAIELLEALPSPRGQSHVPGLPDLDALISPFSRPAHFRPKQMARRNLGFARRDTSPSFESLANRRRPNYIQLGPGGQQHGRIYPIREPLKPIRPENRFTGAIRTRPQLQQPPQRDNVLANVKCFRCKANGHYAKDCPMPSDAATTAQ